MRKTLYPYKILTQALELAWKSIQVETRMDVIRLVMMALREQLECIFVEI